MNTTLRRGLALVLPLLCVTQVSAASITIGAERDTAIFQNNVNNSAGGGPGFFAGTNANNSPRRALISFNLSSIPAGVIITDVQLTLTLGQISNVATTAMIGLFGLTQNWGEGTTGSTATGISGTGQGFAANAGDATWNAAAFSSASWTNPGGDHAATASASLFLNNNTIGNSFTRL